MASPFRVVKSLGSNTQCDVVKDEPDGTVVVAHGLTPYWAEQIADALNEYFEKKE